MSAAPDLTMATLKMVLALGVVLLILWAAQRWLRKLMPSAVGAGRNRWIKVLGTHPLGIKKSIAMVQVPGAILVLGVGTEQIHLLTRIDDPEVMAGVAQAQAAEPGASGFAEQLRRMTRSLGAKAQVAGISEEGRAVSGR
ncbi:MAG: flagellar biosynthetic protein FliO [Desulfobacterales bacterium]|nr:flagellar biosynthetic protein FliO [Desulfobacterales bacterium]